MQRRAFLKLAALLSASSVDCPRLFGASVPQLFDVKKFGALGDGITLDTHAIQSAIDTANQAGGGTVVLSPGIYLSGSLELKSHVELHVAAEATLLGSASFPDYRRIHHWYALLLSDSQEDISISGTGTIDGQGQLLAQDIIRRAETGEIKDPLNRYDHRPNPDHRPLVIEFRKCNHVRVSGVTLRNSSCWVEHYLECNDLSIQNIRVNSTAYWNNDGMDITDCTKVRVTGCDVNSDDDGICLKSDDSTGGCEDVEISNCRIRSSASAFKCGTDSFGGFRNIFVHDLNVYDTYRSAVALECVDGGVLKNVRVERIYAPNTGNAVFLRLGHRNTQAPIGRFDDVVIRDVRVEVPAGSPDSGYQFAGPPVSSPHNLFPSSITGLPGHPVTNVTLENIEILFAGGGIPNVAWVPWNGLQQVPERAQTYPEFSMFGELPAWGYYLRHAEEVSLRNCRLTLKHRDYRPAIAADDIHGLRLANLNIGPTSGRPVIVLDNVKQATLQNITYPENIQERDRIRRLGGSGEIPSPQAS